MSGTGAHVPVDALLDYWLDGAASSERVDAIDEHLMACDECGRTLDELIALGDGVRAAFRAGALASVTTAAFVQRLADQGLRLREYRVAAGGSVDCSVAPDDDLLVSRLEVALGGVRRLDAVVASSLAPGVQHRLEDVPFDPRTGEVIWLPKIAAVRLEPANTLRVTLLSVEEGGTRELGRYAFHHRPWPR